MLAGGGAQRDASRARARGRVALALAVLAAIAGAAALAWLAAPGGAPPAAAGLADCARQPEDRAAQRACSVAAMLRDLRAPGDPTPALARIDAEVNRIGGYPAANCHVLMHTVGRRYAQAHRVTLATLMDALPRSNDPGCAAGFAHGVITAIAPEVLRAGSAAAEKLCGEAGTRYQRYSCVHGLGHAYMRFYDASLTPALRLCRALGANSAADCAQGAYHDLWLAIAGADETTPPAEAIGDVRTLCSRQPPAFVRACWYRSFIDTRPAGYETSTAGDLTRICAGTQALQRQGCITAASVIGSPNPLRQMRVCSRLPRGDVLACVRGVKVQNLLGTPARNQLRVIARCSWLEAEVATRCFEWLGKVLAVITDGGFERRGCPQVAQPAACRRGARALDGPLVTFS